MLADGRYFWNAGIFLMSVKTALAAFAHTLHLFDPVRHSQRRRPISDAAFGLGALGWRGRSIERLCGDGARPQSAGGWNWWGSGSTIS